MALSRIGRYDVVRRQGQGGAGDVYLANDRGGGRVVITLLGDGGPGAEDLVDKARRVAALSHHAIGLAQVGLHGNVPFFATEHFVGETLSEWLAGNPSLGERLKVVGTLADALNHAHERGVVHGGLEPSAVRITDDGCKLTDFALAGAGERGSATAAAYSAPEVIQGAAYSQKAEIHAAGLLFYEVLSGKNPFARPSAAAARDAVANVQPQPLIDARKDVPRDLSDAIMACLEKDPDWRPKDLSYILELAGLASAKAKPSKSGRAAPARSAAASKSPTFTSIGARSRGPSRAPLFAVVAAVLVAAAGGAWFWLRPGPAPPRPSPAPRAGGVPTPGSEPSGTPASAATPSPRATPTPAAGTPTPAPTPRPGEKEREVAIGLATPPPTLAAAGNPRSGGPIPTTPPVTEEPRPTPPPPTEPARGLPTPEAVATPTLTVAEPAVLKTLTPPLVKRGATSILDVHGSGLRPEHRPVILKGKEIARGVSVVRQRLVSSGLIQVVVFVDAAAAPGSYAVLLADSQGNASNPLRFEVGR